MILDIPLLRSFVAVARYGALIRAARRVQRTQSALSMQMKRLETLVGRPLLLRQGRGVALTPAGAEFLSHARSVLSAHDTAVSALRAAPASAPLELRLGCPDGYVPQVLSSALPRLSISHPHASVTLTCAASATLERLLADGKLDVAVLAAEASPRGARRRGQAQRTRAGRIEPLVWVSDAAQSALAREPLVLALSPAESLAHGCARTALTDAGRRHRVTYASANPAGVAAVVRAGLAITALQWSAVPPDLLALDPRRAGLPPLPMVRVDVEVAPGAKAGRELRALAACLVEALQDAV